MECETDNGGVVCDLPLFHVLSFHGVRRDSGEPLGLPAWLPWVHSALEMSPPPLRPHQALRTRAPGSPEAAPGIPARPSHTASRRRTHDASGPGCPGNSVPV